MFEYIPSISLPQAESVLHQRLEEAAPTRVQLLAGPRQVGKTTLLLRIADSRQDRAIYAACDGPEASQPGFWEALWRRAEDLARHHGTSVLLLDEIQHVPAWASRLKGQWDRVLRDRIALHVVASGSSALRVTWGSRESLAGRFERIDVGHWDAPALVSAFGLSRESAAQEIILRGAYPGAFALREDAARWTAYVRDAIVEPAIGRDLAERQAVRKPALLRQIFAIAAASPARIVTLQKIRGELADAGALETVASYLDLLREAFLVAPLPKWSETPARRRAAPPKFVVLSNALLAATDPRGAPDPSRDPARYGAWVENACLAHACNRGQRVTYWRGEPHEVDAVIEGSWGRLAVEVKTGPFAERDLSGLLEFCRRQPEFRPLVVADAPYQTTASRAGVRAVSVTEWLTASETLG